MRRFVLTALIVVAGVAFALEIARAIVPPSVTDGMTAATDTSQTTERRFVPKSGTREKKSKRGILEKMRRALLAMDDTTVLTSRGDTLSYAAGMVQTVGLMRFLKQQHNVDTTHLEAFLKGYNDAMARDFDDDHYAYIAGMQVALTAARNNMPMAEKALAAVGDTALDKRLFNAGFTAALRAEHHDSTTKAPLISDSLAQALFRQAVETQKRQENKETIEAGEHFLDENGRQEGVVTTPSGLQYKVLVAGTGVVPTADDEVTVKYEGRLVDGTVFDSSYRRREQTNKFRVNQVIRGWTEALTMMPVGSKWELYIPQELAYGARKTGNIPPYSALIFTVELIAVN